MRTTFFGHFCAGEHSGDMGPTIKKLDSSGIGAILDYAAEADIVEDEIRPLDEAEVKIKARVYDYYNEGVCDARAKVFETCIRSAHDLYGDKARESFSALKITALGNPALLERISIAIVEIRNFFLKFDDDNTGVISKEQFKLHYEQNFTGGMDVDEVFRMMDVDDDNDIDYIEWSNALTIEELHKLTSFCKDSGPLFKATLTEEERALIIVMRRRIEALADLAQELDVRLMIDAEHTYFQPAIDNISAGLMRKYNKDKPTIFGTYQMYLTDSIQRVTDDAKRADLGGYHFACKLVRGAYMELENKRAVDMGYISPIHPNKQATHDCYNRGVEFMIEQIALGKDVELMLATHNQYSVEAALERAAKHGLGPDSNIYFGQLLGMADHLTYALGEKNFKAYKYVPFGKVKEVMPYLIRRAQENSDMMGGVGVELKMLHQEMKRRIFG